MHPVALSPRAGCALWLVALDGPLPAHAQSLLSPDEVARAGRFRFERDRHRFVAARAALRGLLADHLGESPAALRFVYGAQGKPALAMKPGCRFNLSHTGGWGLVALDLEGGNAQVGVDIEGLRAMPDALALAATALHRQDVDALQMLAAPLRSHAFLTAWTRGEACLKALGTGFSGPGIPIVGIDASPRHVRLPAGAGEQLALIETFELPQAEAIASLTVMTPDGSRHATLELAQAA